jgi:hypothetical protein
MSYMTVVIILIKYPVLLKILKKYSNFIHIKKVVKASTYLLRISGTSVLKLIAIDKNRPSGGKISI